MGNASCAARQKAPVGDSEYGRQQLVRRVYARHGDVRAPDGVNHGIPLSHHPADDPFEAVHEALAELHIDASPLQVQHAAVAAQIQPSAQHLNWVDFNSVLDELDWPMLAEPRIGAGDLPIELPPLKNAQPGGAALCLGLCGYMP